MIVSYETIEVPPAPKLIEPVGDTILAEPAPPELPPPGTYGASDLRAKKLGLYALELRKWGRGLVEAIKTREAAATALATRQQIERATALDRAKKLKLDE